MRAGHRDLLLPVAAAYLAEAEWRAGDEEAADRAIDLAMQAGERLGSQHLLLQALGDFPAVAARRIDAEPDGDSSWHRLGRALRAEGHPVAGVLPATVHVREFGELAVEVDGRPAPLRLTKGCLLLAYLAAAPGGADRRGRVVEALFSSGREASVAAYLRQAAHRARQVLPDGVSLVLSEAEVALAPPLAAVSDSVRFQALLEQALGLSGGARLAVLLRAIAIADRGDHLPFVDVPWANQRRRRLQAARDDALVDAAGLAHAAGAYADAERFAGRVLAGDPLREDVWQVRRRVLGALGDYAAVLLAYRDCERALAAAGARPTGTTDGLVTQLRR
jgi:DNA-binding SARP family transcriptional activator